MANFIVTWHMISGEKIQTIIDAPYAHVAINIGRNVLSEEELLDVTLLNGSNALLVLKHVMYMDVNSDKITTPVDNNAELTTISPKARKILEVLKTKGQGNDSFLDFRELGDVIVWENGFVEDEEVRQAICFLTENDYLIEFGTGLGLTEKGKAVAPIQDGS